jgi:hypothetical protein
MGKLLAGAAPRRNEQTMKEFISHANGDEKLVRRVADFLRQTGFEVWDNTQILPGDNWAASIATALEESEAMGGLAHACLIAFTAGKL